MHDAARKAIEPSFRTQKPDGHFESQDNELDANGQALWALWQYGKITGDRAWLEKVYPQMLRASRWTMKTRRLSGGRFAVCRPSARRFRRRRIPLRPQAPHRRLRPLEPPRNALHGRRGPLARQGGRCEGTSRRGRELSQSDRRRLQADRRRLFSAQLGEGRDVLGQHGNALADANCSPSTIPA